MSRPNVKITLGTEKFVLKSALIGGTMDNFLGTPASMYGGAIDLDELHTALYYANRAVLQILVNELNIPLDKTDGFLVSAMSEALVKEYNNQATGECDIDYERRVHDTGKNQK